MRNLIKYVGFASISFLSAGCSKAFLNEKPNSNIVNPVSLNEFQSLLENAVLINQSTPALSQMASDDYVFIDYAGWEATQKAAERNSYIWAKDIFEGQNDVWDWTYPYSSIFYCNNVLEGLDKMEDKISERQQKDFLKGWALFVRSFMFYDLVRHFSPTYDATTADSDLGVPLKLEAQVDETVRRASVQQTYERIITDLDTAIPLLTAQIDPNNRNRPSKTAGFALLSRIYLNMRIYDKAEMYADSTLALYNELIDYNLLDSLSKSPFSINNDEVIYHSMTIPSTYNIITTSSFNNTVIPNPELVDLYENGDLRRLIFFAKSTTGNLYLKPGYGGPNRNQPFSGLATDEIYLIKAECLARRKEAGKAMAFLNRLLEKRYKEGSFSSIQENDTGEALTIILRERRKELIWRTLRWDDIKRLNKEGANIRLSRMLNGNLYELLPDDPRYVFPIPEDEIVLSAIQQNIR